MRRFLRDLSTVLIVAGAILLADAGVTLAWQEPLSAVLAQFQQNDLSRKLHDLQDAQLSAVDQRALRRQRTLARRMAFLARLEGRHVKGGQAVGRISIPKIGARYVVVQGTSVDDLKKGPGHYDDTPFPGLPGTVAIAGHRTTYLAPFHDVDELKHGDTVLVDMPYGRFTYAVEHTQIVPPTALWVKRPVGYSRLVLSACHPLYSAAQRIIVFARLKHVEPRGAGLIS